MLVCSESSACVPCWGGGGTGRSGCWSRFFGSLTETWRHVPSGKGVPFTADTANWASDACMYFTKPIPEHMPSGVCIACTLSTAPKGEKTLYRYKSLASSGKSLMYKLLRSGSPGGGLCGRGGTIGGGVAVAADTLASTCTAAMARWSSGGDTTMPLRSSANVSAGAATPAAPPPYGAKRPGAGGTPTVTASRIACFCALVLAESAYRTTTGFESPWGTLPFKFSTNHRACSMLPICRRHAASAPTPSADGSKTLVRTTVP
mmetsp:Transcript_71048/g.197361  ORF Transcript_71048/g.197361 Transcript_71048/m.197361 type:complete len:261 (-) Transcript_71048:335-1117(-)